MNLDTSNYLEVVWIGSGLHVYTTMVLLKQRESGSAPSVQETAISLPDKQKYLL